MTGFAGVAWSVPLTTAAAFVAASCVACALAQRQARAASLHRFAAGALDGEANAGRRLDDRLLAAAETASRRLALGAAAPRARASARTARWCAEHVKRAGLAGRVTDAGFCETRRRASCVAAACGAVLGVPFSTELAVAFGVAGAAAGRASLGWAVRQRERQRADELERHLSEMLEVVALGLRSGLSFDRSLQLYAEHFDTLLSRSCASAQRQWSLGLVTREQALRDLAATFDSPLFARVVENVVRSLRFGSSLAESLEAAAAEARTQFRSRKQEQVAKASVKMMVPTGALMLPAMLLLVLGPVLLELMEGF